MIVFECWTLIKNESMFKMLIMVAQPVFCWVVHDMTLYLLWKLSSFFGTHLIFISSCIRWVVLIRVRVVACRLCFKIYLMKVFYSQPISVSITQNNNIIIWFNVLVTKITNTLDEISCIGSFRTFSLIMHDIHTFFSEEFIKSIWTHFL